MNTKERLQTFVIEREIPGAGQLGPADLRGIASKSCDILETLGPRIQWIHSYVTDDKIYCLYESASEALIREHAEKGGFPANSISPVRTVIDPSMGE